MPKRIEVVTKWDPEWQEKDWGIIWGLYKGEFVVRLYRGGEAYLSILGVV